ncbi:MAG: dihydroorotase [Candidatus Eisenbacteria bacterium]|uniref:Dihydroorotase n=1 Tax=Eiseniibacteriota bacterium TaxID=2212470 RepID=A0A956M267_UNCEI|nr:dihydroorotase [Candidatus Eisenbacteria bacterium]
MQLDLLLRDGTVLTSLGAARVDIGIRAGRIEWVGTGDRAAREVLSVKGLHVLPGVIDSQVHFREPGAEHKEDLQTGSRAAVLGGVATVYEMPNTEPATSTPDALADKLERARGRMWCDHAFFVGARPDNLDRLGELERLPGTPGVKMFLGRSTGGLLVQDESAIRSALAHGRRRMAVHSEDQARLDERHHLAREAGHPRAHPDWRDAETARRSTERLLRLSSETGRPVHVLHVTTAEEVELLAAARSLATFEVTPQHLTLAAPDCYEELGTFAQMNPPIREARHREALWEAVRSGLVDVIGSDHAPHTRDEKARPYPESPAGMPGVQTLLPLMLDHVSQGRLSLERLVELVCSGPARIYGARRKGRIEPGYDADFTIVDLETERRVEESWLASRCGWSPFTGRTLRGWPIFTIIRGHQVMRDGEVLGDPSGVPVEFDLGDSGDRSAVDRVPVGA